MHKEKESILIKLKSQNIPDEIIKAVAKVKRELFLPDHSSQYAYEDIAIPLDDGSILPSISTISFILSILDPKQDQKILEIGSGSGYILALISEIIKSGKVYGLEINPRLAIKSKKLIDKDSNINIFNRSGAKGFQEQSLFDRILVSASFENKEKPYNIFLPQLKDPGILVVPIKNSIFQVKKESGSIKEKEFPGYTFVKFVDE